MRNRIFGLIGAVWGGLVVAHQLFGASPAPSSGAYAAGRLTGLGFGALLFFVGLYYFVKSFQKSG